MFKTCSCYYFVIKTLVAMNLNLKGLLTYPCLGGHCCRDYTLSADT